MIENITGHSLANTVRMGGKRSAVYLVADQKVVNRIKDYDPHARIIPTHGLERAVAALHELLKSDYQGLLLSDSSILSPTLSAPPPLEVTLRWEDLSQQSERFAGKVVRVSEVLLEPTYEGLPDTVNSKMEAALKAAVAHTAAIQHSPDGSDFLRDARSGGMYDSTKFN